MHARDAEQALPKYEGLIHTHALRVLGRVEGDLDDIRQAYRTKAWRALIAFDPARSRLPERRFVFGCLVNAEKDMLKRRRRPEVFLEDQSPCVRLANEPRTEHEQVYGDVDEGAPLVPNTLTQRERQVIVLLYRGHYQTEIAVMLDLARTEMEGTMRSIRAKMSDWRPNVASGDVGSSQARTAIAA